MKSKFLNKKIIFILIYTLIILLLLIAVYWYYHPTHYKFNDRFIIGKTAEKIIQKYGEFSKSQYNKEDEITYGAYMIRDNTPEFIMGYDDSLWYEVYFKNGIAEKVELREGWYGG